MVKDNIIWKVNYDKDISKEDEELDVHFKGAETRLIGGTLVSRADKPSISARHRLS